MKCISSSFFLSVLFNKSSDLIQIIHFWDLNAEATKYPQVITEKICFLSASWFYLSCKSLINHHSFARKEQYGSRKSYAKHENISNPLAKQIVRHRQRHAIDIKAHCSHQNSFLISIMCVSLCNHNHQKWSIKGGTARVTISFPEFKLLSCSLFQTQQREQ